MPLELQEVTSDSEFDEIIPLQWLSYESPFNGFFILFCPTRGSGDNARANSIQESKERQIQWFHADSSSRWIKVVDTDTGMAVGAALWHIHESNPFSKPPPPLTAYWWPEGDGRRFVDMALGQWMTPRVERMRRPHLLLEMCFVHPEHRRRGAGSLLTEWGIRKADEMGVEAFVESTDDGKPVYAQHGFAVMNDFDINPTIPDPSEEWKKLQKELLPMHGYFMWRPIGGNYERGKSVIPWQTKS
ncbi:MAG: hypothetical protein M1830_007185 [Pleopsidium flavum]|nr:MAG: hypothetical protein M1830_007185 [Pleopsidium flavum]